VTVAPATRGGAHGGEGENGEVGQSESRQHPEIFHAYRAEANCFRMGPMESGVPPEMVSARFIGGGPMDGEVGAVSAEMQSLTIIPKGLGGRTTGKYVPLGEDEAGLVFEWVPASNG
jgi:hypothetical protein